MAGHTAGHGVDGVFDVHAFLLEQIRHLAQHLLRLRHRHAIARHHDDLLGVLHHIGRVFRAAGLDRRTVAIATTARARHAAIRAKAAQQHIDDRAVHPLAHDVGENGARGTHQRAGHDQQQIANGETNARRRPAGIAVQHGDHDRHIRAANGDDQQIAQREGQTRDQPEEDRRTRGHKQQDKQQQQRTKRRIDLVLPLEGDGRARHPAIKLEEGDDRTREGDGTNGQAQRHLQQRGRLDTTTGLGNAKALRRVEGSRRHSHRGHADQRVEGRHQLRQRGHGDPLRQHRADRAANREAGNNNPNARERHARLQHGGANGDSHADHAVLVAPLAGLRVRQAAQRQNEQHRSDEVAEGGKRMRHGLNPSS